MNYNRKDLANLYGQVRGKEVPTHRYLSEAKVTFEYEEGEPQTLEGISDKTAYRVADYLQDKAEGSFILKEDYKVIQKLAEKSGFKTEDRFLKILFQGFNNVNYDGLRELVDKKDGLNVLLPEFSEKVGSMKLYNICKPQLEMFLPEEDHLQFYNMLWARDFKEGNVSVGNGELALALLTEAKKGNVGDLEIGGTSIELKTGKGRVISARGQNFADDRVKINQIAMMGGLETSDGSYTLDDINASTWNSTFCKQGLTKQVLEEIVNKYPVDNTDNNVIKASEGFDSRIQYICGHLLHAYGNGAPDDENEDEGGHKFDIWLGVYQSGKLASGKGPARFAEGTWSKANYINVKTQEIINQAIGQDLIKFGIDGDGVYGYYPKSNSTASGAAKEAGGMKLIN